MPIGTVPADVFVRHNGCKVYYVYKNDDINNVVRDFLYTTEPYACEGDASVFDIRDLPNPSRHDLGTLHGKKDLIKESVDSGAIKKLQETIEEKLVIQDHQDEWMACCIARDALADAEFFDATAKKFGMSDAEMKAFAKRVSNLAEQGVD